MARAVLLSLRYAYLSLMLPESAILRCWPGKLLSDATSKSDAACRKGPCTRGGFQWCVGLGLQRIQQIMSCIESDKILRRFMLTTAGEGNCASRKGSSLLPTPGRMCMALQEGLVRADVLIYLEDSRLAELRPELRMAWR